MSLVGFCEVKKNLPGSRLRSAEEKILCLRNYTNVMTLVGTLA